MTSTMVAADDRAWQVAVIVAYLAMVAMNALANALPLFGRNTGEISNDYPSLFTPAAYTFGVWGLIYLALAGFAGYQALGWNRGAADRRAAKRDAASPDAASHDAVHRDVADLDATRLTGVRPLFVLSCLFNVGWLVAWHAHVIWLSELVMLGLLFTLIALYRRSGAWRGPATSGARWFVHVPFSLYLGWITVATVANTAITLLDLGFDGGSAAVAITVVVVAVAAGLGLLAVLRRRDGVYALVIAWGLGGVASARAGEVGAIVVAALVSVGVLVVAALWALVLRSRQGRARTT